MPTSETSTLRKYPCEKCPLRPLPVFRDFERDELEFVSRFKKGELSVDKGASVLLEGSHSAHLYTVLIGWGFRYKLLPDGRRQILNFVMPGDLIGLQGSLTGEMQHTIEALSNMLLCVFERDRLLTLYEKQPALAFDVTWLASREEQMLDENLLSLGRRTALERAAYLIAFINQRAYSLKLNGAKNVEIPISQQHIADTLGLSIVHTNKTLRKLVQMKLIKWVEGGCEVRNSQGLLDIANWEGLGDRRRPLI